MSKQLIKKHTEGITHNTIGSILSTYIIKGVPLLISWLVAHAASVSGLALHWIILLFLCAFALVTFIVNQVRQLFSSPRQRETERQHELPTNPTQPRTLPETPATVAECPDKWLHEIAEEQAKAIQDYIESDCYVDHSHPYMRPSYTTQMY